MLPTKVIINQGLQHFLHRLQCHASLRCQLLDVLQVHFMFRPECQDSRGWIFITSRIANLQHKYVLGFMEYLQDLLLLLIDGKPPLLTLQARQKRSALWLACVATLYENVVRDISPSLTMGKTDRSPRHNVWREGLAVLQSINLLLKVLHWK
jgi:hypothetical protein